MKRRELLIIVLFCSEHAIELGNAIPEKPLLFLKPPSAYVTEGNPIKIPPGCSSLHHEIELGIVIGSKCSQIAPQEVMNHVAGYWYSNLFKYFYSFQWSDEISWFLGYSSLALDMTARGSYSLFDYVFRSLIVSWRYRNLLDFQDEAKKKGQPWTLAKGFDTSCPVSSFIPKEKIADPHNIELWCTVNGITRQKGSTKDMIFNIPTLLSYISKYFTLETGDVILTGTPAGVGPVQKGDLIQGGITDVITMAFHVAWMYTLNEFEFFTKFVRPCTTYFRHRDWFVIHSSKRHAIFNPNSILHTEEISWN